jgi:hypothetical protein
VASEPSVQGEAIWHHKYTVRKAMIPRFITYAWSKKILSTGRLPVLYCDQFLTFQLVSIRVQAYVCVNVVV